MGCGAAMPIRRVAVSWLTVAVVLCSTATAQTFPVKPIRIVTYPPGGGTDFASRVIAQGLSSSAGWQVVVDNRPGGVVQGEILMSAPPDGYTLLLNGSSLWLAPFMQDKVPYDPIRDFSPITLAGISPNILVAHPSLPVKSVKELIALAKARPGELNYGSGPTGTPNHLGGELLKAVAGIDIVRVNYKGIGPAMTALVAGEIQCSLGNQPTVGPYVKNGRLRALAVTSSEPSTLFPQLPTVAFSRAKRIRYRFHTWHLCARQNTGPHRRTSESGNRKSAEPARRQREIRERRHGDGWQHAGPAKRQSEIGDGDFWQDHKGRKHTG